MKRNYAGCFIILLLIVFFSFMAVGEELNNSAIDNTEIINPEDQTVEYIPIEKIMTDGNIEVDNLYDPNISINKNNTGLLTDYTNDLNNSKENSSIIGFYPNIDELVGEPNITEKERPTEENIMNSSDIKEEETEKKNNEQIEDKEPYSEVNSEESPLENKPESREKYSFITGDGEKIQAEITDDEARIFEEIDIEREVIEHDDKWIKRVNIESEEHFDVPINYTSKIQEIEDSKIEIYWEEKKGLVEFEEYDKDNDGLRDEISFIVPHLSNQTFEIRVFSGMTEINESIAINITKAPIGNISGYIVEYNISIRSCNISTLECDFLIRRKINDEDMIFMKINKSFFDYAIGLENGIYYWSISCLDTTNNSITDSKSGEFGINIDYTPTIEFYSDKSKGYVGEQIGFFLNISLNNNSKAEYTFDKGDGVLLINTTNKTVKEKILIGYQSPGNYTAKLIVNVNNLSYQKNKSIEILPLPYNDTIAPTISLIKPDDDEVINQDNVTFSYEVVDNIKIDNCTFNLYYYNNSLLGTLAYTKLNNSLKNDEIVTIKLVDFDEGDYSWEIECYDNSSNYEDKRREFSIDLIENVSLSESIKNSNKENTTEENTEEISEIDEIILTINNFLILEEKFDKSEKEAAEDIGLTDELKFFKKKIMQMKLDLEHNLDYMRDDDEREKRREEILNEIETIKKEIPINIEVIESKEYIKNSLDVDIEEVISKYAEKKGMVINKKGISEMKKTNERLQGFISVSARVKKVSIEYYDRKDEITLISKKIEIKNNSFDSILEVIPKEIAENIKDINVINEYGIIAEDPIIEIKLNDVNEGRIVYYIKGFIDLKETEKVNSIVFKEEISQNKLSPMSGFASFVTGDDERGFGFYFSWIILLILIIFLAIGGYQKIKIVRIKRNKDTKEIIEDIKKAEKMIKSGEIDEAKINYAHIKGLYTNMPKESKKFVYPKIAKIKIEIDKREIAKLTKEFIKDVKEDKKKEATIIYHKIKESYSGMPKRYKNKVYEKIKDYVKRL